MRGNVYSKELLPLVIAGKKTVTRRLMNPQPTQDGKYWSWMHILFDNKTCFIPDCYAPVSVGEVCYIRERALYWMGGAGGISNIAYEDDPEIPGLLEDNNRLLMVREVTNITAGESVVGKWQWRSPYAMPESLARWFQKCISVRAERMSDPVILVAGELDLEGGTLALPILQTMAGKWVWRIEYSQPFKRGEGC